MSGSRPSTAPSHGDIPSPTPRGEAPHNGQNAPGTATASAGAFSYVKAEQTAKGYRLSSCVVPGTPREQMADALLTLLDTLRVASRFLPVEPGEGIPAIGRADVIAAFNLMTPAAAAEIAAAEVRA